MDRAVSCSATMMGVRYTARELWEFVKATNSFVEDGAVKEGIPGVNDSTAFLTEFCELLLAAKPELENAPLPLHFRVPITGLGSLDVVFTRRGAYLGRLLMPPCILTEEDIPADMKVPQDPSGTALPGGTRDTEADVDTFNRRSDFVRQFCEGEECCPDPDDLAAVLADLSCDELDFIVLNIRTTAVDSDEAVLETIEALLRNRLHEQFQRTEIVLALNETALSVESTSRITTALCEGERFSNEAALIRLQLERQGVLDRPEEEDDASASASAILRVIDAAAVALHGVGLPRTGPVQQAMWSTLHKWSLDDGTPAPAPITHSPPGGIVQPKTIGPEF